MSSLLEEAHVVEHSPPPPPSAPIASFQLRRSNNDTPTELLIQTFDDRILVILTQNGKVGCLVQASLPQVTPLPHPPRPAEGESSSIGLPPSPDSVLLTPLLGTPPDQTLHSLYTSQIATLIWWTLQEVRAPRRPVVVGLALNRATFDKEEGDVSIHESRGEDADEDGGGNLSQAERERFMGLMGLVVEWPGP